MGNLNIFFEEFGDIKRQQSFLMIAENFYEPYGKVQIWKELEDDCNQIAVKDIQFTDSQQFFKYSEVYSERQKLNHPKLVSLISFQKKIQKNICQQSYSCKICYEYIGQSLLYNIYKRKLKENKSQKIFVNFYNENELWFILSSILQVTIYLKNSTIYENSYFYSNNVLIDEKTKQIKLFDRILLQDIGYESLFDNKLIKGYFPSPNILKAQKDKQFHPLHCKSQSDVFNIGMLMLQAASLEEVQNILYNIKFLEINKHNLDELINYISQKYSNFFISLISQMVCFEESQRPSLEDCLEKINQLYFLKEIKIAQNIYSDDFPYTYFDLKDYPNFILIPQFIFYGQIQLNAIQQNMANNQQPYNQIDCIKSSQNIISFQQLERPQKIWNKIFSIDKTNPFEFYEILQYSSPVELHKNLKKNWENYSDQIYEAYLYNEKLKNEENTQNIQNQENTFNQNQLQSKIFEKNENNYIEEEKQSQYNKGHFIGQNQISNQKQQKREEKCQKNEYSSLTYFLKVESLQQQKQNKQEFDNLKNIQPNKNPIL